MQIPIKYIKMHHLESTNLDPFIWKYQISQFMQISTFIIPNILRMSVVDELNQAD